MIAGSYKSEKPINITGIDEIHLKCECKQDNVVNGIREPILLSFALSSPPGHKIYKETRIKLFKKINKSVLSHKTFYFEDDDQKPVGFNGETVSFTCQLIKIKIPLLNTYKTWIHTIIGVFILLYTYNYLSSYTFIEIM